MADNEKYEKPYLKQRIQTIMDSTGSNLPRMHKVIKNLSYEFGVPEDKYDSSMDLPQLVEVTFKHQTKPSQLETDMQREAEDWENIRPN